MVAYLALEGLARPVALHGCDELLPLFAQVLGTWPKAASRATPAEAPVISIERRGERYVLNSPWAEPDLADDSGPGTICSALVDLATEYARDNPHIVSLHCGAVRVGGRLLLFPAATRSGKSTLVARLAAAGHKVFADDLLAVDPASATGCAFGILPRLRRPIPRAAGAALHGFVRARTGISDRRQVYLALTGDELARFGETCPLGAIVMPERLPSGAARLEPVGRGAAVERLLLQNLIRTGEAADLFDRFVRLAGSLPAFHLRYADLDEATELLSAADWPAPGSLQAISPAVAGARKARARPILRNGQFERDPAVMLREIDGDRFLVSPGSQAVFKLDAIASGVWSLLEEPISEAEIASLLTEAFPSADRQEVARDVRRLLKQLLDDELVIGGR